MFEQIPNTKHRNSERFFFRGVGHPMGHRLGPNQTNKSIHQDLFFKWMNMNQPPLVNHDDGFPHVQMDKPKTTADDD